jgi:uncharacterized membrane protein YkoI
MPLAPEAEAAPEVASISQSPQAVPAAAAEGAAAVAELPKEQHSEQRDQNTNSDPHQLSPDQAVALVQRRYHAQVVRTNTQTDASGRQLYVFRLLSAAGRVWTVRIDAHSGAEVP